MSHFSKSRLMTFSKLKYFHKFVLISIIMIAVLIMLIGQLAYQSLFLINFTNNELKGIRYLNTLIQVTRHVQNYRSAELNYLLHDKNAHETLNQVREEADATLSAMDKLKIPHNSQPNSLLKWQELKSEWELIKESHVINPEKSNFENTTMLIENLNSYIDQVCDSFNITLDPEILTYYLGDTYCTKLPAYIQELALIRDISDKSIDNNSLSPIDRNLLIINENLMNDFNKLAIKENLDKITKHLENTGNRNIVSMNHVNTLLSETTNLVNTLNHTLLAEPLDLTRANQASQYTDLLNVAYTLQDQVATVLKLSLEDRIKSIHHRFYFNIAISLIALILICYLFIGIYHSIIKNSRKILHHAKKMEEGDFHNIIHIRTHDEMAKAADHLDHMRHSFYLIINEVNAVLDKIVSGNDPSARVTLACEGSFDKLEKNINTLAEFLEILINHFKELTKGMHWVGLNDSIASLNKITDQSNHLIARNLDVVKATQDEIQPYYHRMIEQLDELTHHIRNENAGQKNDVQSLEDIILQTRILSLNVASLAEGTKSDNRIELIRFATEIRALAERIESISHMIEHAEMELGMQRKISSHLIESTHLFHSIWSGSHHKLLHLSENLFAEMEKQKQAIALLNEAYQRFQKIAESAKEILPTNKNNKR